MKTLARLLVILAAALAVVGVTVAVVQGEGSQSPVAGERAGRRLGFGAEVSDGRRLFEPGEPVEELRPGRGPGGSRGEGEFHAGREGGLAGWLGLAKNVAIFVGLATAVAALSVIIDRVRRRRAAPPAAA